MPPAALTKLAERAWTKGVRPKDTGGQFKKWLQTIDNTPRVYGEVVYVFTFYRKLPSLVTVYQVPVEFKKYLKA